MVVPHTECKMASATDDEVYALIHEISGTDARSLDFGLVEDQLETLRDDVQRIRSWPFLPAGVRGRRLPVRRGHGTARTCLLTVTCLPATC